MKIDHLDLSSRSIAFLFGAIAVACGGPAPISAAPATTNVQSTLKEAERSQQATFDRQPADDAATKAAQEKIDHVVKIAKGTTQAAIKCKKSICRLQTSHDSKASFLQFYEAAVVDMRTAWHGSVQFVRVEPAGNGIAALAFLGPEPNVSPPDKVTPQTIIRGCPTTTDCPKGPKPAPEVVP
jgi:hypothetical protein